MALFDQFRASVATDRAQFFKDFSAPFYGANRAGSTVSQGLRDSFWMQAMMGGLKNEYDCIKAFSETDQTSDLQAVEVPTLVLRGDDDQVVPLDDAGLMQARLVKGAILQIYPGAPHGLCSTEKDKVNADLLAFIKD